VTLNGWNIDVHPPKVQLPIGGANFGASTEHIRVYVWPVCLQSPEAATFLLTSVESNPAPTDHSVVVTVSGISTHCTGFLKAIVAVKGVKSTAQTIANIKEAPILQTASPVALAQSSAGNRLRLLGRSFGRDALSISIAFAPAITYSIHSCDDAVLIVDVGSTSALSVGTAVSAFVRTALSASDAQAPTAVATIVASVAAPDITPSTAKLSYMAKQISITGSSFGQSLSAIVVYLKVNEGNTMIASLKSITDTQLVVNLAGMSASNLGILKATVTRNGVKSLECSIATISDPLPVVSQVWPLEGPLEGNTQVTLKGENFHMFHTNKVSCSWGDVLSPATYINETLISCITPRHEVGNFVLHISSHLSTETPIQRLATPTAFSFTFHASILIADSSQHCINRFNADTGVFIDKFVPARSGGLTDPWGIAFGPNKDLFVASGGTSNVLQYHGQSGQYQGIFCSVPGGPRGLIFHYGDLYVVSALNNAVYRFNGMTGALRGLYLHGRQNTVDELKFPWTIKFDGKTNDSYVSSQNTHHIIRFNAPTLGLDHVEDLGSGRAVFLSKFDAVWTQHKLNLMTAFDFATDCVYAVSPMTNIVVQYNRTTGQRMSHLEDVELVNPMDIAVVGSEIHVCLFEGVRVYHRASHEFLRTHIMLPGMKCGNMLRHTSWQMNLGFS